MSRQTSRQNRVFQLQSHHYGFFPRKWKYQKSHLEILGSLIFWVGLTLNKPAWSASTVSSAAVLVSNTDQKGSVGVTATSTQADAIQSHPEVRPPEVTAEVAKERSQPVDGDATRIPQQGDTGREEDALTPKAVVSRHSDAQSFSEETFSTSTVEEQSNLSTCDRHSLIEPRVSASDSLGEQPPPCLSACASRVVSLPLDASQARVGEFLNSNSGRGTNLPLLNSSPPSPLSSETQSPIPFSIAQPHHRLTPEQKQPYRSTPSSLMAEAENAPTSEPQPSPSENSSDSQQPASGEDPELGKLRLRELAAPPPPAKPAVYLLGGVGYFRSNNIFSGIDPIDDGLFRAGVTLLAAPSLGPHTSVFASAGGNIIRYGEQSQYDYDELNFNLGISQQIGSRTYGKLGWSNRQLFSHNRGDRFLNEHSLYLELGRRDVLAKRLTLDTFYQFRLSWANPSDRSQVINYVGASLGYNPIPPLEVALDYQFAFADFTQQERQDQYHQLLARLTYTLSPNSRAYLYGGPSFGHSGDPYIDFDGFVFGAGVNLNFTLF